MNFSKELAMRIGVEKSVLISNIYFWIEKNKANRRHFYDGRYWTYNSASAFAELFPFWTGSKVSRMLRSLEEDGYLLSANYNPVGYDRTKWYSITEKCIVQMCKMDCSDLKDGLFKNEQPIPDIKPDIKPDINIKKKSAVLIPSLEEFVTYASKLPIWHEDLRYSTEAKYNAWVADDWKDGNGNKIKNWKTKLQNTLPHLKRVRM